MNLREAAQQALEALEYIYSETTEYENKVMGEAITALRAALAEDAMQRLTDVQQEMACYGDGNVYRGQRSSDSKVQTITFSKVETVEPVAFIHKNFERRIREVLTEADFGGDKLAFLKYCMSDGNLLPIYAAPPKREPLTESFLEALAEKHVTNCYFDTLTYARAIERAHGIGGEE